MFKTLSLASIIIACTLAMSYSASRNSPLVTKVSQNNGNTRTEFLVTITSSAWVQVLPASETRRYAVIHATSTSITEVCLSTVSASEACTATSIGRHMPQVGIVIEDYNEAALYAKGIAASASTPATSIYLMGERQHDSGD